MDKCFGRWQFFCCWFRAAAWQPDSGSAHFEKKNSRWCITAYSDALKQVCCVCLTPTPTPWQSFHHLLTHLWLTVVLQRHGDDIDADDEGDDQVQVVAGTQSVDSQPGWTVWRIVGQLLGLWRGKVKKKEIEELKRGRDFVGYVGRKKTLMEWMHRW